MVLAWIGLGYAGMQVDVEGQRRIALLALEGVIIEVSIGRTAHTGLIVIVGGFSRALNRPIDLLEAVSPSYNLHGVVVVDDPVRISEVGEFGSLAGLSSWLILRANYAFS